jgi:hypothetical protein
MQKAPPKRGFSSNEGRCSGSALRIVLAALAALLSALLSALTGLLLLLTGLLVPALLLTWLWIVLVLLVLGITRILVCHLARTPWSAPASVNAGTTDSVPGTSVAHSQN